MPKKKIDVKEDPIKPEDKKDYSTGSNKAFTFNSLLDFCIPCVASKPPRITPEESENYPLSFLAQLTGEEYLNMLAKDDLTGIKKNLTVGQFMNLYNSIVLDDKIVSPMLRQISKYPLPMHPCPRNLRDFLTATSVSLVTQLLDFHLHYDAHTFDKFERIYDRSVSSLLDSPVEDIFKEIPGGDVIYQKLLLPVIQGNPPDDFTIQDVPELYLGLRLCLQNFLGVSLPPLESPDHPPKSEMKAHRKQTFLLNNGQLNKHTRMVLEFSILFTLIKMIRKIQTSDHSVWKEAYEIGVLEGKLAYALSLSDPGLQKGLHSAVSGLIVETKRWQGLRDLKREAITLADEKWKNGSADNHVVMAKTIHKIITDRHPVLCRKYKKQFTKNSVREAIKEVAVRYDRLWGVKKTGTSITKN